MKKYTKKPWQAGENVIKYPHPVSNYKLTEKQENDYEKLHFCNRILLLLLLLLYVIRGKSVFAAIVHEYSQSKAYLSKISPSKNTVHSFFARRPGRADIGITSAE